MATVLIIQCAWISIELHWSIKKFLKLSLELYQSVLSGFPILRGKEVIGYLNLNRSCPQERHQMLACAPLIMILPQGFSFYFSCQEQFAILQFVQKNPLLLWSIFLSQSWDISHYQCCQHLTNVQQYFMEVLLLLLCLFRLPLQMGPTDKSSAIA